MLEGPAQPGAADAVQGDLPNRKTDDGRPERDDQRGPRQLTSAKSHTDENGGDRGDHHDSDVPGEGRKQQQNPQRRGRTSGAREQTAAAQVRPVQHLVCDKKAQKGEQDEQRLAPHSYRKRRDHRRPRDDEWRNHLQPASSDDASRERRSGKHDQTERGGVHDSAGVDRVEASQSSGCGEGNGIPRREDRQHFPV